MWCGAENYELVGYISMSGLNGIMGDIGQEQVYNRLRTDLRGKKPDTERTDHTFWKLGCEKKAEERTRKYTKLRFSFFFSFFFFLIGQGIILVMG